MDNIILKINALKQDSISKIINQRIEEFQNVRSSKDKIFSELCFCLLTANFQAEKSILIQKELELDFFKASEKELAKKLKEKGHRFWPQRAERIVNARNIFDELFFSLDKPEFEIREWIVKNVKGLGMKESSHFLRNIGFSNLAIIDFHIVDLLVKENIIKRPKTLNKKAYLEIESILNEISKKANLNLAKLDLYLWYLETGKVLK